MDALIDRDYFTDHSILRDPYEYFEAVREKAPVHRLDKSGIVVVTGFAEAIEVLNNTKDFSSWISVPGPAAPLPFVPEGSDITAQIEAHRTDLLGGDLLVTYDGGMHTKTRSLLGKLFVPSRLKANEEFFTALADTMVRDAVAKGGVELIRTIATPFVTMVIADLLGVPQEDRQLFMDAIDAAPPPGSIDPDDLMSQNQPLVIMGGYFIGYVTDRRENPREDILTELANATYPDGTTPDAVEIVKLATFLFGAGQDTSAKLLGNAMRFLCDDDDLQRKLRADPSLIPAFLEESLRLEGSTKMTARIAKRDTSVGGVDLPAGSKLLVALSAANRDPRRWDDPRAFELDRPKIREHVGFGRGAHVCIGAPLARVEVRVIFEKFFEHTEWIAIDEGAHGPAGARNLEYEPSFIIRGLAGMNLKLTPAKDFKGAATPPPPKERRGFLGLFGSKKKAEQTVPKIWTLAETKIGVLLDDAQARAIIDRHFPGVSTDSRIGMGKNMTFRTVQKFAPEMFTTEAMDAVDAELAALGPKAG